jgi:hypothetical protein
VNIPLAHPPNATEGECNRVFRMLGHLGLAGSSASMLAMDCAMNIPRVVLALDEMAGRGAVEQSPNGNWRVRQTREARP